VSVAAEARFGEGHVKHEAIGLARDIMPRGAARAYLGWVLVGMAMWGSLMFLLL
jgi:hypothetical protein